MTQLTISAVAISNAIAHGPQPNRLISIPCIQLTLSDGSQFNGDCILTGTESLQKGTRAVILEQLREILVGRTVTPGEYLETCATIANAAYVMQEMRYPDPVEKTAETLEKEGRREMLSIIGIIDTIEPEPVLTDVAYPLPSHIIRGATAALLLASAHAQNNNAATFVRSFFPNQSDEEPSLNLGLHVDLAEHTRLLKHSSAIYYPVPIAAGAESLGNTAEKFQRYLRQLGEWVAESWQNFEPEDRPWLFVDLNGATHRLMNGQVARTLGTLFGFGKTGNEKKMIFANAVANDGPLKTANDQTYLQSLMKSKKMEMTLAAGSWTNTAENIALWLEKCKPAMISLTLHETANLGELISMMVSTDEKETQLILIGSACGNTRSWGILHEIAAGSSPIFYIPAGGLNGFVQATNR